MPYFANFLMCGMMIENKRFIYSYLNILSLMFFLFRTKFWIIIFSMSFNNICVDGIVMNCCLWYHFVSIIASILYIIMRKVCYRSWYSECERFSNIRNYVCSPVFRIPSLYPQYIIINIIFMDFSIWNFAFGINKFVKLKNTQRIIKICIF